jgi:hypothetical protein
VNRRIVGVSFRDDTAPETLLSLLPFSFLSSLALRSAHLFLPLR